MLKRISGCNQHNTHYTCTPRDLCVVHYFHPHFHFLFLPKLIHALTCITVDASLYLIINHWNCSFLSSSVRYKDNEFPVFLCPRSLAPSLFLSLSAWGLPYHLPHSIPYHSVFTLPLLICTVLQPHIRAVKRPKCYYYLNIQNVKVQ